MARNLERACFDCIMFADTLMVSDSYGQDMSSALKNSVNVPRPDPVPLVAVIGAQTRHLGIVATLSTLAYPPFLLARVVCTIDHIAGGRFGWNIVTSGEDSAAQNFGLDRLPDHDLRYEMADEHVGVVKQLFGSWEAAAQAANERIISPQRHIDQRLVNIGVQTDIDFSQFDLDKPLPHLTTNGESTMLAKFAQYGSKKTLRELVRDASKGGVDLIGTPDQVATRMGEIMAEVGGDGFLLRQPFNYLSRRYISEVTEGLVPALQRRGLVRTEYTGSTLGEPLFEY